jgi:hypothetical protein
VGVGVGLGAGTVVGWVTVGAAEGLVTCSPVALGCFARRLPFVLPERAIEAGMKEHCAPPPEAGVSVNRSPDLRPRNDIDFGVVVAAWPAG